MSNQVNEVIKENLAEEVAELGTMEVVSMLNDANVSLFLSSLVVKDSVQT